MAAKKIAFDQEVLVDMLANGNHFGIAQFVHAAGPVNPDSVTYRLCRGMANAMNVGKRDVHALVRRDIHARNARHGLSPFINGPLGPIPYL